MTPEMEKGMTEAPTCEIKWFDEKGRLLGDANPSIGRVRVREHDFVGQSASGKPSVTHIRASRWMHICAEHAQRLAHDPEKQEVWEWER
jgi:hypothetical protein